MTLEYALRQGQLAEIAHQRFTSQFTVAAAIAAVSALIVLLQWVLA